MASQPKNPGKKGFPLIPVLIAVALLVVLLAGGGFAFAATQESNDPFCASCHTQPETTYVQRSTGAQPVDLASFHTGQSSRCIDCHSGQGILGRMSAELMGARNAWLWYTGKAVQPAVLHFPIGDGNCVKCHEQVIQPLFTPQEQITVPGARAGREGEEEGRANHWHQFLARWQTASSNAGSCVSCHQGHVTGATAQAGFMNSQTVQAVCDACHQVLRREED